MISGDPDRARGRHPILRYGGRAGSAAEMTRPGQKYRERRAFQPRHKPCDGGCVVLAPKWALSLRRHKAVHGVVVEVPRPHH
jgi:hypothetical protein